MKRCSIVIAVLFTLTLIPCAWGSLSSVMTKYDGDIEEIESTYGLSMAKLGAGYRRQLRDLKGQSDDQNARKFLNRELERFSETGVLSKKAMSANGDFVRIQGIYQTAVDKIKERRWDKFSKVTQDTVEDLEAIKLSATKAGETERAAEILKIQEEISLKIEYMHDEVVPSEAVTDSPSGTFKRNPAKAGKLNGATAVIMGITHWKENHPYEIEGAAEKLPIGYDLQGGSVHIKGFDEKIPEMLKESGELLMELHVVSDSVTDTEERCIVAFASATEAMPNVAVLQAGNQVKFVLRTSIGDKVRKVVIATDGIQAEVAHHLMLSYKPGNLTVYVAGEPVFNSSEVDGDFSHWTEAKLIFGNNAQGTQPWKGKIKRFVLRSRTVTSHAVLKSRYKKALRQSFKVR